MWEIRQRRQTIGSKVKEIEGQVFRTVLSRQVHGRTLQEGGLPSPRTAVKQDVAIPSQVDMSHFLSLFLRHICQTDQEVQIALPLLPFGLIVDRL